MLEPIKYMNLGIDCRRMLDPTNEHGGGVERFTFTLVTSLLDYSDVKLTLFVSPEYSYDKLFKNKKVTRINIEKGLPFLGSHFHFAKEINRSNINIFFSPITSLPLGLKKPAVVTVHDLAIYDQPEWFPEGQWFSKNILVPRSLKKAKKIVAVSHKTKKDVQRIFNISEEKISVIHNTLSEEKYFQEQKIKITPPKKDYILFIGTIEPRKNLSLLFDAFLSLVKEQQGLHLAVIGKEGWKIEEVFEKHAKKKLKESGVIFYENINEKEKQLFLKNAKALVFPSLYEGFGLPVLEAMQQRIPVIASRETPAEEFCQNCLLHDPKSKEELAQKIIEALKNENILSGKVSQQEMNKKYAQSIISTIKL